MEQQDTLDRRPPLVIKCPDCGSAAIKAIRHWNDPPRNSPAPAFDPTHACEACGFRWIYRSPKEKFRSFIVRD